MSFWQDIHSSPHTGDFLRLSLFNTKDYPTHVLRGKKIVTICAWLQGLVKKFYLHPRDFLVVWRVENGTFRYTQEKLLLAILEFCMLHKSKERFGTPETVEYFEILYSGLKYL